MSDGTDASVGVLEPGSPSKLIDNSLMASGKYRQRVEVPTVAELMGDVLALLEILVSKTPQQNTSGQQRALLESGSTTAVTGTLTGVTTVTTVTTCTTVTTVSAVSSVNNVLAVGGLNASYDQYSQINACAFALRDRITVA